MAVAVRGGRIESKKRRRHHARCPGGGKVRYRDRLEALEALRRLAGVGMARAYECPTCRGWHLTRRETY